MSSGILVMREYGTTIYKYDHSEVPGGGNEMCDLK